MSAVQGVDQGVLDWLLEEGDPGPRYLALRDVVGLPGGDPVLRSARRAAHERGPIDVVLEAMGPEGYWVLPGPGYNPKYRASVWSLILLAQLGATVEEDPRVGEACGHILEHALTPYGQFSSTGTPSGTAVCLQGNLCWAMLELGCDDPRLEAAFDWLARTATGDGIAAQGDTSSPLRYYAGTCGPGFRCGANATLPCAWGATKAMMAFGRMPADRRTAAVEAAIEVGLGFLLDGDPATAPYPSGYAERPSGNWWKFGFPVFYVTDLLQVAEAVVALGRGDDARLQPLLGLVGGKRDEMGRWRLEYGYEGKTWIDAGEKRSASKWVTVRALRVLRQAA